MKLLRIEIVDEKDIKKWELTDGVTDLKYKRVSTPVILVYKKLFKKEEVKIKAFPSPQYLPRHQQHNSMFSQPFVLYINEKGENLELYTSNQIHVLVNAKISYPSE
jgi:hypothetical protein